MCTANIKIFLEISTLDAKTKMHESKNSEFLICHVVKVSLKELYTLKLKTH